MLSFEAAASAIVAGDISALKALLEREPKLIHARSKCEHGAMLLHYTAANGVEEERQKTPANVVAIAELLLEAGADVNARANLYGGCTTMELVATSIHPERAGVQEALLQTLLDHGAEIGNVTCCLDNNRWQAAHFLASHGAPVISPTRQGWANSILCVPR